MADTFSIQIPTPCAQPWNNMTPSGDGRHCSACNIVVVDFTEMTVEEIKHYFQDNCGPKICGRFRESQLGESENRNYFQKMYTRVSILKRRYQAASMILWAMGLIGLITGCTPTTKGEPVLTGDTTYIPAEKSKQDTIK
jgi:hypothetical protein